MINSVPPEQPAQGDTVEYARWLAFQTANRHSKELTEQCAQFKSPMTMGAFVQVYIAIATGQITVEKVEEG